MECRCPRTVPILAPWPGRPRPTIWICSAGHGPRPTAPCGGGTLANVNGRFELWSILNTPRSGDDPCAGGQPTAIYLNNTVGHQQGARHQYRTLTPDFVLGPVRQVVAAVPPVRPMPSDYEVSYTYPFTLNDPNGKQLLYTSTRDPLFCTVDYSQTDNPFRGLGYVVTTLEDVP